jgi:signal transduction histidine kinase
MRWGHLSIVLSLVAALLGTILVLDGHTQATLSGLTSTLEAERLHIETITSVRRDVRKTHVAILERWLAPGGERATREDAIRIKLAVVVQAANAFTATHGDVEEELSRQKLLLALATWRSGVERALGEPGAGPVDELQGDVDDIDREAEAIVALNSNDARANDARVISLRRRLDWTYLAFGALLLLLLTGAWWWRTKVVSEARICAAEQAEQDQKELMLAQADLFATMSHELRTPLVTIRSLATEVSECDDEDARCASERIAHESVELLATVNNILDFAKLQSREVELRHERVDVREVVERSLGRCKMLCNGKAIDLRLQLDTELPPLRGDFVKLQQLFSNLIGNAIKFTDAGSVTVIASVDKHGPGYVVVEVADTGIGMRPEELDSLWEPFRQSSHGIARKYGGTGLGLPIVHRLVALHGGSIDVESSAGAGSTFRVRLPTAAVVA